jgi:glucose-6-phosphate isomerase
MTSLPLQRPAWAALQALSQAPLPQSPPLPHLRELLQDPDRPARMTAQAAGITLDYSRQRITPAIFEQLLALAQQSDVAGQRDAMLRGDTINNTEGRAVLHVALRGAQRADAPWPASISQGIQTQLARMAAMAQAIRSGHMPGFDGQPITDVVTLGIGGSDLGPRMAVQALAAQAAQSDCRVRLHFVSNPDASALFDCLRPLDPARTLFIVSSKTFTTQETLLNAASAQRWLRDGGCPAADVAKHLIAITTLPERAHALGFAPERILQFWDWVGGRYSLWSAIGLPVAIAIGTQGFEAMLAGAHAMDRHFETAPLAQNLPVLLALIGVWNRNFLGAPSHLITSYAARLVQFPNYVQQMDMESNGKHTHIDGTPVTVDTGPIIWGGLGIDGQHAYYQLVHQGRHRMAVDFIGVKRDDTPLPDASAHLHMAQASLLAQARALAIGRDAQATYAALLTNGLSEPEAQRLAPHRSFEGDVPSNLLWLDQLDAHTLGALLALYEHKVFCQAAIWDTQAFDQWGVELGKQVTNEVLALMNASQGAVRPQEGMDAATLASIASLTSSAQGVH